MAMSTVELHFGSGNHADVGFPRDAWAIAQRDLAPVEPVLRELGRKHGLQLVSDLDGRVAWPARRLRAKRLWRRTEIRLMVNPEYLNDGKLFYVLFAEKTTGLGWFRRDGSHEIGASYSAGELRDAARLARDVEGLIEHLGLARGV